MVNWKGAVAILVVLGALGVYAYVTRNPTPTPPAAVFFKCDAGSSIQLKVDVSDKSLEVSRASTSAPWRIVTPVDAEADPAGISRLFAALAPSRLNTIDGPADLKPYGLDAPMAVVTCRVKGGNSFTLSVGGQSFDGSGTYVQLKGDGRVYVVSGVQVDILNSALASPPVKPSPAPSPVQSPSP